MRLPPHPDRVRTSRLDFGLARGAIACVASLRLLVVNDLSLGPRWLAPALEVALLVPLSTITTWNQGRARHATTDAHWAEIHRFHRLIRRMAVLLTASVTVANTAALAALVHALLNGKVAGGPTLLVDALNISGTNVIIFALWFWTTDRGGAALRGRPIARDPDFLFPQMTMAQDGARKQFVPGFVDYLFLAFTNVTAFSPTDTLPLTARAKLLMLAEALISLLTVALVAARAVNILA